MFLLRRPVIGLVNRPTCIRRGIEEFFDNVTKPGEAPVAGRAWKAKELRLKSLSDLHKLWYILLKERNKLLTEKAQVATGKEMPNPTRINKVRESMRGIKIVIGERMRLNTTDNKLELTTDKKEIKTLTQKRDELRQITGTPEMALPKEEVPYEERTMKVPRPELSNWWKGKADAKTAARAQRRQEREDPEFEQKEQAKLAEIKKQKDFAKSEATRLNRVNRFKNRERAVKLKAAKSGVTVKPKATRQKRVKLSGKKQLAASSGKR